MESKYQKLYDSLKNNQLTTYIKNITRDYEEVILISDELNTKISLSNWKEKGITELLSNVLPQYKLKLINYNSNLEVLDKVCNNANTLLDSLKQLDEYTKKYEETPNTSEYSNIKREYYNSINTLKQNIDNQINSIKSLVSSLVELDKPIKEEKETNEEKIDLANEEFTPITTEEKTDNTNTRPTEEGTVSLGSGVRTYNFNGQQYYIADTPRDLDKSIKNLTARGIGNSIGLGSGQCLKASGIYMDELGVTGGKYYNTDSYDDIMTTLYNQLSTGNPAIIHVKGTGSREEKNLTRHYVVAVGYNSKVKSASDLKEEDILILDSYNCKLRTMSKDGRYLITGYETKYSNQQYGYQAILYNNKKAKQA